jgi:cation diffusion facilitator CzcD-associated flavoprotein CzcO
MGQDEPKPERILKTDLREYSNRKRTDGPYADDLDIDVLIVGAGFGGAYSLYEMRKQGYSTVLFDAGTSFGGTWRWNVRKPMDRMFTRKTWSRVDLRQT